MARFAPQRLFVTLVLCLLVSLAFCLYCSGQLIAASYYFTPMRGWELLIGAGHEAAPDAGVQK